MGKNQGNSITEEKTNRNDRTLPKKTLTSHNPSGTIIVHRKNKNRASLAMHTNTMFTDSKSET